MLPFSQLLNEPFPLLGIPFMDRGRGPCGFDCWGLVMEIFRRCGIILPDYRICCTDLSGIDAKVGEQRGAWTTCDPGALPIPSLVVMRFNSPGLINHVGTYIGAGRFIHTAEKMGVNIDRVDHPYWKRHIEGFYTPNQYGGRKSD